VELAEVQWYAFVISRLRVLSEALHKTLRDHGGHADLFCLREKARRPNAIAFFKRFIREVAARRAICLCVRRQLWVRIGLVIFIVSIFYERREWACVTSVYLLRKLLLCLVFVSALGLTSNAALWEAPCHLDSSSVEVNLQVVLVEPGYPKDHALLPKPCDRKQDAFGVAVVCHDHVNNFADASSFVQRSIYIVNRDWLGQLSCWQLGSVGGILIDKVSGCASIDHGLS